MKTYFWAWNDLRFKTKNKAVGILIVDFGGPEEDVSITDLAHRIVQIMSETAVFGVTEPAGITIKSEV